MEKTMMRKCRWCGQEFPTYLLLFQHRRLHSINRPYACNYNTCCQAFTSASGLQRHSRIHLDRRLYMCNICKTRFLYRSHLKLHRCRIRNTKVYKCHLCLENFVQCLSLAHHLRSDHQDFVERKIRSFKNRIRKNEKAITAKMKLRKDQDENKSEESEDTGQQKILLKIKAGTCTTLISPGKEEKKEKSSHMKHKRKKNKKKLDLMQPAVSVKNGLILKIRPVLKPESEDALKKHSESRTKLKHKRNKNKSVEPSCGLKLKIKNQGNSHIVLNSEGEQTVPKLLVSKKNLENLSKLSGSVLTSKNIVKKYKNKKNVPENTRNDVEVGSIEKENQTLVPRVKNGIIIHKDRLGNYTLAEQIGKTSPEATDIPKCTGGVWKVDKAEKTKSPRSKKHDVPKFASGIWEVMPSPRPDGTPDFLKLRLSPQKPPPKLETNPDVLYESPKLYGVDTRLRTETALSEDSDIFGASPVTEKELDLGLNSVHDSGIEVLSSSSCNRSNGNSVRSVLFDENSPSYFHGEDSLLSFDSPGNDSSKYEHSICGRCGGIVMEQNNNTYSPTKCHCDMNSPLQDFQEKAGYIYISPLKDPSVPAVQRQNSPKLRLEDKMSAYPSIASESVQNFSNTSELNGKEDAVMNKLADPLVDDSQYDKEKSVFDFNEDEDFSGEKPVLDHVKNPRVLSKTEHEKKQESILLADLQQGKEAETPKKRSRNCKLSRSPRRKPSMETTEKSSVDETSHIKFGLTPSEPIIIEDESPNRKEKDLKMRLRSKSDQTFSKDKLSLSDQTKSQLLSENDLSSQLKDKVVRKITEPIIVAIAKTSSTEEKESESEPESKKERKNKKTENDIKKDEKNTVIKNGEKSNDHKNSGNFDAENCENGTDILSDLNDSDIELININNSSEEKFTEIAKKEKKVNDQTLIEKPKNDNEPKITNSEASENASTKQNFDEISPKLVAYLEADGKGKLSSADNDSDIEEIQLSTEIESEPVIAANKTTSDKKEIDMMMSPIKTHNLTSENDSLVNYTSKRAPSPTKTKSDMKKQKGDDKIQSSDRTGNSRQTSEYSSAINKYEGMSDNINGIDEEIDEASSIVKDSEVYDSAEFAGQVLSTEKTSNVSKTNCIIEKETVGKSNSEDDVLKLDSKSELGLNCDSEPKVSGQNATVDQQKETSVQKKLKPPPVILKEFDDENEDSLLQVPVPDNEKDLNAALEQAGLGVKTVVLNPDEDSLLNIPEMTNPAAEKLPTNTVIKSPLDLFQEQFLSFLSHTSPEEEKENKRKSAKRSNRRVSNKTAAKDSKTPDRTRSISKVDRINSDSSDSDFEVSGPRNKKRKPSHYYEKNEVNSDDENRKSRKLSQKDSNESTGGGINTNSGNVIIVKSPNMEDDIEIELPKPDSDSDFNPNIDEIVKKKYSKNKKMSKIPHVTERNIHKHRDFDCEDSDFIISDSEFERAVTSDSDLEDSAEPRAKRLKSCRQRRESLRRRAISVNEDDENSKDSQEGLLDTQSAEVSDRSKRSKRGRKSICPCCIGSPWMHRRESHEDRSTYKLPTNHKQFIADSIRLLELKAKIHRLFLSLFPDCKELITQSDINTIAFDDLIDDVLSTVKSDIQFEPGNDIFTKPFTNLEPTVDHDSGANFQQVISETVQQLVDDTVINQMSENSTSDEPGIALENLTENSSVVFVPGIQLMYSDESVLRTNQASERCCSNNSVVRTSQVPETREDYSNYSTIKTSHVSETEVEESNEINVEVVYPEQVTTGNLGESRAEIAVSEFDETNQQKERNELSSDTQNMLVNQDTLVADYKSTESNVANKLDRHIVNAELDPCAQKTGPAGIALQPSESIFNVNDDNEVFINNTVTTDSVPILPNTDPSSTSIEELPTSMLSKFQQVESESIPVMEEDTCEEIVITIDLGAAKVQLCKNPRSCLKHLQSKIVRLVWCLLPDLQISPGVYESLENLEFLLDLIIISNNNSVAETKSVLSPNPSNTMAIKHSRSKQENCSSVFPTKRKVGRPPLNRTKLEISARELKKGKESKELLKRRTKSTEKACLLKKLKTDENDTEKMKHKVIPTSPLKHTTSGSLIKLNKSAPLRSRTQRNSAPVISRTWACSIESNTQNSKVTNAKQIGAVAKKCSKKPKSTVSDLGNASVVARSGIIADSSKNMQPKDNMQSKDKLIDNEKLHSYPIYCSSSIEDSAKDTECMKRSCNGVELEFERNSKRPDSVSSDKMEGNVFDKAPRTNERNTGNIFERMNSLTNDRIEGNVFEIVEAAKPDKSEGNIFDKMDVVTTEKKDKIDKSEENIFNKIETVAREKNEKIISPLNVSLTSPSRTPSPEKSVGSFSPDSKRRSSDKNIFELLQPVSADSV